METPASPASFADQLADAARSMQGWSSTQLTLEKVVLVATEIIQGCDFVGISIVHSDGIDTPVGSDETLNRIDELQFVLREGPCFDALHLHEIVHSPDLANDQRWPRWGPLVVQEVGVVSIVSYRLYTTQDTLGAMNLYSTELDAFDAVLLDPPRAGAAAQSAELARAKVRRVVYGSCDPGSFARDARTLQEGGYRLDKLLPVDQFLWSPHIELIALFARAPLRSTRH